MTDRGRTLRRFAASLLCSAIAGGCSASDLKGDSVAIRGRSVSLEIVRTPVEQALGLGNRDALAWGHGMLFPYRQPGFYSFWMHRMRFDIDIVWIRESRVVGIAHQVRHPPTPEAKPERVTPPELVDMVLEVSAGFAQAHGWRRGDRVEVSYAGSIADPTTP